MANNPTGLVATLKQQHRNLQNDLKMVTDELKPGITINGGIIVSKLAKFRNDLMEHLKLENGTFYPDYINKIEARGEDTKPTIEFVKMMDDIGRAVMGFLDKYSNPEVVESSKPVFDNELQGIIGTLNTRIETEEDGVYGIYLVF